MNVNSKLAETLATTVCNRSSAQLQLVVFVEAVEHEAAVSFFCGKCQLCRIC